MTITQYVLKVSGVFIMLKLDTIRKKKITVVSICSCETFLLICMLLVFTGTCQMLFARLFWGVPRQTASAEVWQDGTSPWKCGAWCVHGCACFLSAGKQSSFIPLCCSCRWNDFPFGSFTFYCFIGVLCGSLSALWNMMSRNSMDVLPTLF